MTARRFLPVFGLSAVALGLLAAPAPAVLTYSDPNGLRQLDPVTNAPANSGYQYQGLWRGVPLDVEVDLAGTPIAPNYFISAKHAGYGVGNTFVLNGVDYHPIATYDSPNSDLRIVKVDQAFPANLIAPLYTKSNETGKAITVFGRGVGVGSPVATAGQLRGWTWGADDGALSWGQNTAAGIAHDNTLGDFLAYDFSSTGCSLVDHDSGGGVFINDGGVWKLAGVNYGVDYNFARDINGNGAFHGALFNANGFFEWDGGNSLWVAVSGAGTSYSTRISSNVDWINSVVPEPSSAAVLALAAAGLLRRRKA